MHCAVAGNDNVDRELRSMNKFVLLGDPVAQLLYVPLQGGVGGLQRRGPFVFSERIFKSAIVFSVLRLQERLRKLSALGQDFGLIFVTKRFSPGRFGSIAGWSGVWVIAAGFDHS